MDWKEYFKISVLRETLQGPHRYFHADLHVREDFDLTELSIEEFDHLKMTPEERKHLSLSVRKVLLRHSFFKTPEFNRIIENFSDRLLHENDQLLTFSTHGAGVYLFAGLIKKNPLLLREKKLICYTSDLPLDIFQIDYLSSTDIHLIYRPYSKTMFKNFPSLWQRPIIKACASF